MSPRCTFVRKGCARRPDPRLGRLGVGKLLGAGALLPVELLPRGSKHLGGGASVRIGYVSQVHLCAERLCLPARSEARGRLGVGKLLGAGALLPVELLSRVPSTWGVGIG